MIKGVVFSVLKPIIAGRKSDLSRLVIIVSVVFWVWVLGPIGAMLAVPLTLIVKEILPETSEEGRPLAAILLIPSIVSSLSTVLQVNWAAKINDGLGWLENALQVVQEKNR